VKYKSCLAKSETREKSIVKDVNRVKDLLNKVEGKASNAEIYKKRINKNKLRDMPKF
jgi:hypothetical protein